MGGEVGAFIDSVIKIQVNYAATPEIFTTRNFQHFLIYQNKKLSINCYSLLDNNQHFVTAITRYEESQPEKRLPEKFALFELSMQQKSEKTLPFFCLSLMITKRIFTEHNFMRKKI